ncbi:MAG: nitrate reductase molybdenum cofactor assembly chaperone [Acidobacteria bacterium]|jgi:nitrate reductase delta subunit|nr:nitrate reductase molybdenum cofactor assembly chaperone [Acidobacteriota bacterium]HJN43992.1 nitrate reductase molybdenum cofactor assembly chaperone [Vicinamibacterales bacterium]|tara:strand:- start:247 stop:882 length:636 start_codon:yes stop_codon:yes gene_type:complete
MVDVHGERRVLDLMAGILEYPQSDPLEYVSECRELLSRASPEAAAHLGEFHDFVAATPLGHLQEVYTGTFDLNAACDPYLGFHLFGESYKRSAFMVELKERYRAHGFTINGSELPDHLAVVLRFLASCDDTTEVGDIVHEGLLPVLQQMLRKSEKDDPEAGEDKQPELTAGRKVYTQVLEALQLMLPRIEHAASDSEPRADGEDVGAATEG